MDERDNKCLRERSEGERQLKTTRVTRGKASAEPETLREIALRERGESEPTRESDP